MRCCQERTKSQEGQQSTAREISFCQFVVHRTLHHREHRGRFVDQNLIDKQYFLPFQSPVSWQTFEMQIRSPLLNTQHLRHAVCFNDGPVHCPTITHGMRDGGDASHRIEAVNANAHAQINLEVAHTDSQLSTFTSLDSWHTVQLLVLPWGADHFCGCCFGSCKLRHTHNECCLACCLSLCGSHVDCRCCCDVCDVSCPLQASCRPSWHGCCGVATASNRWLM